MVSLDELKADPAFAPRRIAALTSGLVRCRSVNPGGDETAVARQIMSELRDIGCEADVVEFSERRPSIAAVIEGRRSGPRLVLNGHMDTVAAGDECAWTHDPFGGVEADGIVWGRGAVDMKGGLAAQLACARALAARRHDLLGSVVLHFAAGEECGEPGTLSLLRKGYAGDWGIVTEPTHLQLATASKGVAWFEVTVRGESAHAGVGSDRDPLKVLSAMLAAIDRYGQELSCRRHPLLGSARCSVTTVRGGSQHNATAEQAAFTIDRRLLPGETKESALAEIRAVVGFVVPSGFGLRIDSLHHTFDPAEVTGGELVEHVEQAVTEVTGGPLVRIGTAYGSDVRHLIHSAGMEAVTFGPGEVDLMHSVDERIEVREVRDAALALALTAASLLSGR